MYKLPLLKDNLKSFIDEAFKHCYGGDFKKSETIERPGFFEMYYEKDDLSYRDSFAGFYTSTGQEIVRYKEQPIWSSNYGGGVIEKYTGDEKFFREVEKFLIKALDQQKGETYQPRGPKDFKDGDWKYGCIWEGDIDKFSGLEKIYFKKEHVFYHQFFGGAVIGL